MSVKPQLGALVATPDQQVLLSSLFAVTPAASNPAYLIVSGLDRNEYTAGYQSSAMGSLTGNGVSQGFSSAGGDADSIGIVFTYQGSTGSYYNATFGYFNQARFTASANINDNVSLSIFGTSSASLAAQYATSPYVLEENPKSFSYLGSVSVVTQPVGAIAAQATPNSVCAAAQSFVGDAWNMDGCWVLASNISAKAGASLPASSTLVGVPGVANGEWVVAYNGPAGASSGWEANLTAGEIVSFVTNSGGGHITTVVSGTGAAASLIDNITYGNGYGGIENAAHDGSANDIIVAAPHAASQEFTGVNPADVVVYELNTPIVRDLVSSLTLTGGTGKAVTSLVAGSDPLTADPITEWQLYNTSAAAGISIGGVVTAANSAGNAATIASLSNVMLTAGSAAGSDTLEVRAYNGSYWGDWQSLAVTLTGAPKAPVLTSQIGNQSWTQGQKISLALPANSFTDPQGQTLTYTASLSNGAKLPAWLSFNATSRTFSGTVPAGIENLTLKVTATDSSGLSASENFGVAVPAAAPSVTNHTANQTWLPGQKISLALSAASFTDPQNETLTYSASQSNGAGLPSWLNFNAATRTFSGTVPAGAQALNLQVTATDSSGLSASETFGVTVTAAGKASGIVATADRVAISPASTGFGGPAGSSGMQFAAPAGGSLNLENPVIERFGMHDLAGMRLLNSLVQSNAALITGGNTRLLAAAADPSGSFIAATPYIGATAALAKLATHVTFGLN